MAVIDTGDPMRYPQQSADRLIWQDRFTNLPYVLSNGGILVGASTINRGLTGGQVRYYAAGHSLRWSGAITVVGHAIVSASGSDQALWSLGTGAARRIEVGITGAGLPYAWGTAQVTLGEAIPDGHHDFGFAITASGAVTCVVDGELWGSGTVTMGAATDRLVVGGSCLGGLAWLGKISDIKAARRALQHEEIAAEQGVSDYFTPALLNPVAWFRPGDAWWGYGAQPDNTNSDFSFWTGVAPDEDPLGWTKSPDPGVAATHIERAGNACRMISAGALVFVQKSGVSGNRYTLSMNVISSLPGSSMSSVGDEFAQINTNGIIAREWTATIGALGFKRGVSPVDTTFTNVLYRNISLQNWRNFYGTAGGVISNATPTTMPWSDQSGIGARFAGTDSLQSSLPASAWKFLHYNASTVGNYPTFHVAVCASCSLSAGVNMAIATLNPGFGAYTDAAGRQYAIVYGTLSSTSVSLLAGTIVANQKRIIMAEADGIGLTVRSGPVSNYAPFTHVSANANPYESLRVGGSSYTAQYWDGGTVDEAVITSAPPGPTDSARLGKYLKAAHPGAIW